MKLRNRLQALLDEKQVNLYQLHQLTGIAYHVLRAHAVNTAKRIDYATLGKICEVLNCTPSEFFTSE